MTEGALRGLHFVALAVMLGGPLFRAIVWHPAVRSGARRGSLDAVDAAQHRTARIVVTVAALVFALTAVADVARVSIDLFGTPAQAGLLLTASHVGRISLWRVGLAIIVAALAQRRQVDWLGLTAISLTTLATVATISLASHAAGDPGWFPLVADILHTVAVVSWGGGALHFALLTRDRLDAGSPHAPLFPVVAQRFSRLGLSCVATVVLTGTYAAVLRMYGLPALTTTPYGITFSWKIALFGAVLMLAAFHRFYWVPRLDRLKRTPRGFVRSLRLEAILLAAVLVTTGSLTLQAPPEDRPAMVESATQAGTAGELAYELAVVPLGEGALRFELLLTDTAGRAIQADAIPVQMTMLDHEMAGRNLTLHPDANGRFTGEGVLSMSGQWLVEIQLPGATDTVIRQTVKAAGGGRDAGRGLHVSLAKARMIGGGLRNLTMYGLMALLGVGAFLIAARPPRFYPLLAAGGILAVASLYLTWPIVTYHGYPTTYDVNPIERTEQTVARARALYERHCLACHGVGGRGDGPAAAGYDPPPADLTAHARAHPEGELYWWISHGIPGTAMPAFGDTLDETERWILVDYVRSFPSQVRPELP